MATRFVRRAGDGSVEVTWRGDEFRQAVLKACAAALNEVGAEAVREARPQAPKRSGKLRRAIRVIRKAKPRPQAMWVVFGVKKRLRQVVHLYRSDLIRKVGRRAAAKVIPRLRAKLAAAGWR